MLSRQAESTSGNTQEMAKCLWMSCRTWWEDRERLSPFGCSTMHQLCVAPSSTRNIRRVVRSPWWTHWVCPPSSLSTGAADLQWPELAQLICSDNPDSKTARAKAVIENPALTEWFFYHQVMEFLKAFYIGALGATDYWLRFEWQHQGSLYVYGLAWLPNTPDVEQLGDGTNEALKEEISSHADQLVSTINPAVFPYGSNVTDAPAPKVDVCNNAYGDVQDFDQDLADLVATCQRHTHCSASYCLCTKLGKQEC